MLEMQVKLLSLCITVALVTLARQKNPEKQYLTLEMHGTDMRASQDKNEENKLI